MQDDYEGNFTTRRVLIYTLDLLQKLIFLDQLSSATKDIIKKVLHQLYCWRYYNILQEKLFILQNQELSKITLVLVLTNINKDITTEDVLLL
jgi:hypothetical protein